MGRFWQQVANELVSLFLSVRFTNCFTPLQHIAIQDKLLGKKDLKVGSV